MIRCNFNDLKVFRNNLGKLTNTEYDRLAEECCNEIAARLLRMTKHACGYRTFKTLVENGSC